MIKRCVSPQSLGESNHRGYLTTKKSEVEGGSYMELLVYSRELRRHVMKIKVKKTDK